MPLSVLTETKIQRYLVHLQRQSLIRISNTPKKVSLGDSLITITELGNKILSLSISKNLSIKIQITH